MFYLTDWVALCTALRLDNKRHRSEETMSNNVMQYHDGVNDLHNLTTTTTSIKIFFRVCPLGQEWRPEICDCECPRSGDRAACRFGQQSDDNWDDNHQLIIRMVINIIKKTVLLVGLVK